MEGKILESHYNNEDALVDGKFRGRVLIATLCSHTICFENKHCGGCQRGNGITIKVVHIEQQGEWYCWVSTCIPNVCPIIPLLTIPFPLTFSPDLTHVCGKVGFASCRQQPNVTALSAIPLIIAQRSPCVESNCGVQGVSGAKTSEESPLEDNKKTADWLQTTQRGIRAFHMNLNVILTGNLPLEREKGKDSKRDGASEGEWD